MKLLLHTCCGPCFLGVWEDLKDQPFEVTNFFYNPNIYPEEECQKRRDGLREVAGLLGTELVEEVYSPKDYNEAVAGKENLFPRRCLDCYGLRLKKTAEYAKGNGYQYFSTTLLVSPYQNREAILEIGKKLAQEYGINFLDSDWRPFFREGQNSAKENNIYRQNYCGCEYSKEEARK